MQNRPTDASAALLDGPRPPGRPPPGGAFQRFLDTIEWLGNLLPHPVTLFAFFALAVILASGLADWLQLAVTDPRPEGARGRSPTGVITAVSLMNADGVRRIVENLVSNFVNFVPLGTVLVALLGVGVAEASGLLSAGIRALVLKAPARLITVALVFTGVISNTASEAGYVILIPLAGVIFLAIGRHPLAGIAAAFAGVSGGYSANLLIGTVDPLLAGITQEAAQLIDPGYVVHPLVNWYFMIVSTFLVTGLGTWVTVKIVEPKLGTYDPAAAQAGAADNRTLEPLSREEKRGLVAAGLASLAVIGLILLATVPQTGVLRNPQTGDILDSPFLRGVVALIFVFFLVPGVAYGVTTGRFRRDRDVIDGMANAMSTMGLYIVLVFFAAQFVAYFGWTNLGAIVAVSGAGFLDHLGFTGPLLFVPFILVCALINLMIGSASAQWAVTAPIFVPMLMLLGYSPEVIQAAYRIGDSVTNIITPMMSYFGLVLAFAARYDRNIGIGTIVATMLPYTLFFIVGWTTLFLVWVFVLDLPVGPGTTTYYRP
jgi:aminobenzoyl-glutamate transport protein